MNKFGLFIILAIQSVSVMAQSANGESLIQEQNTTTPLYTLSRYRDNYILPAYVENRPDQSYFAPQNPNGGNIKKTNFQFQFSFKYGLFENIFTDSDRFYFSYTQKSTWQAYDKSAYFRDTQYQPELFIRFKHRLPIFDWSWSQTQLGLEHQSNGKGGIYERSWNRIYTDFQLKHNAFSINFRPSVRVHLDSNADYNPDIENYLGYGTIKLSWRTTPHKLSLTLRNQIESGFSRGYGELTWQFPIYKKLCGFIKLESGYGLTISEYNHYNNAIGIGLLL